MTPIKGLGAEGEASGMTHPELPDQYLRSQELPNKVLVIFHWGGGLATPLYPPEVDREMQVYISG